MWGKKSSEKISKKRFFIIKRISWTKMRWKNPRNNFSRNNPIVPAKKLWLKIFAKIAKKLFLYSHEYRVQKMGGKTRETIFPETH